MELTLLIAIAILALFGSILFYNWVILGHSQ